MLKTIRLVLRLSDAYPLGFCNQISARNLPTIARIAVSHLNTGEEIDTLLNALRALANEGRQTSTSTSSP